MNSKALRRWLVGLAALIGTGTALVAAASRFDGFRWMFTAPLLLAALCLASGTALVWLWAGEIEAISRK